MIDLQKDLVQFGVSIVYIDPIARSNICSFLCNWFSSFHVLPDVLWYHLTPGDQGAQRGEIWLKKALEEGWINTKKPTVQADCCLSFQGNSPLEIFAHPGSFKILNYYVRWRGWRLGERKTCWDNKKDPGFGVRHVFSKDVMNQKLQVIGFLAG